MEVLRAEPAKKKDASEDAEAKNFDAMLDKADKEIEKGDDNSNYYDSEYGDEEDK